jgi:hypothetical protein
MSTPHRVRLSVGLDQRRVPAFLEGATTIHGKLVVGSTLFQSPPITFDLLHTQIQDASSAHQATKTNKNAIGARTAKIAVVWTSLETLCTFVQQLCDAHPEQAMTLAEASGFHVIVVGTVARQILEASLTTNQGEVALRAYASKLEGPAKKKSMSKTYLWRHTLDEGKGFVNDEPTPVGHTVISGLPLMTKVGFEVAVKDATGTGAWSQTVTILVH